MTRSEPDFSRSRRNKNRKGSNLLVNSLIGVVVLLIIIVATTIIFGNNDDEKLADSDLITTDGADDSSEEPTSPVIEDEEAKEDEEVADELATENAVDEQSGTESSAEQQEAIVKPEPEVKKDDDSTNDSATGAGSVTYITPADEIIDETVINASWEPIGTTQTGEHASQYDRASVDWVEKQQALAYATGLSQDSMIFWKIKNGGGPQKSVGIVSSTNKAEKYRVYLEWVDGEGWKPVKMDVLNTLDFDY